MDIPRVVIAGTSSKVGKTMISIGLMRLLVNRGYEVQPYKVGPDFIDPGFHHLATGRYSRNLDSFMLSRSAILETFIRNFSGADVAIIEGKTGLYDSSDAVSEKGSVAEVSKILKAPVVLVANVERLNRTAAAIILGYKLFDPDVLLKGVILNRVGSERHAGKVRTAVEKLAGVRVLGVVPRKKVKMPYRHLGLVTAYEREDMDELLDNIAEIVEKHVDVDKILEIAEKAPPLDSVFEDEKEDEEKKYVKIGVIRDQVFSFYYQDNLDELSKYAELVFVNSLTDKRLPDVDALYIGGGFPEVFAEGLEKNEKLRNEIYDFCQSGNPVYAECGGLMYLGESLETSEGEFEMVGFLPLKTKMYERFQAQGYSVYRTLKPCIIAKRNQKIVGHEFHYSRPTLTGKADFAFRVERGFGIDGRRDGILKENTLGCYIHVHFLSDKSIARRFVKKAMKKK
ncbi:cobyrinate a,c-diamide synthase [Archaeoglobus sp.]|jgi:cobyrinic acid a,c-diamide synthase|uniref:cobyrinate a,c-diamide synthase n=1 Tax=Archaeoglobus sp. TaxID=1872626 RepID=UPI0024AB6E39|nr:cobyrinate a,c-diamide synthase [Archaeoglobus sp.]MDI3497909.1 cobyrinic acid a,c-diamide synthase [Archaeoglobus sp.]